MRTKKSGGDECWDSRHSVGKFFETLCRRLIGGDLCPSGDGDIASWSINTGFEVKGCDNNHGFRLEIGQLQNHVEASRGFPFTNYVYCLCKYSNRETLKQSAGNVRKSLLSSCRNDEEVRLRLAQGNIRVYFLDIRLLQAMRSRWGNSSATLLGRSGADLLKIDEGYLYRFRKEGRSVLDELGLVSGEWKVRQEMVVLRVEDLFETHLVFPVTLVLKKRLSKKVESVVQSQAAAV